jgi:hypothetical protein
MKVAIMQPYFLPYIGYFQLINAVDVFVLYDNIEYTKKGWINRNRVLVNGIDEYITLPIKKDSDYLNIVERELADSFDREKVLRQIKECYKKAPFFNEVIKLLGDILGFKNENLFDFISNSIKIINNHLDIKTEIVLSSTLLIDHSLKSENKVLAICKALDAKKYINPIGGMELYSLENFTKNGIQLQFLKSDYISYKQFNNNFIPWLSIIDVLMFNDINVCKELLNKYQLL